MIQQLIVLLHISKLKHPVSVQLSLTHRLLQPLVHTRIRVQVLTPFPVDQSKPFCNEVNVYTRVGVVVGLWIHQSEMKQAILSVINVGDQFPAFT